MNLRLPVAETTLARFCEQHHIRRLSLFGSQLKGAAHPDSDIDLLRDEVVRTAEVQYAR